MYLQEILIYAGYKKVIVTVARIWKSHTETNNSACASFVSLTFNVLCRKREKKEDILCLLYGTLFQWARKKIYNFQEQLFKRAKEQA